jgi:hypothetical protein
MKASLHLHLRCPPLNGKCHAICTTACGPPAHLGTHTPPGISPHSHAARSSCRTAQVALHAFDAAREACQGAINLDAGVVEPHVIRLRMLMQQEKWEEAIQAGKDSLQHHQQHQELRGVGGGGLVLGMCRPVHSWC